MRMLSSQQNISNLGMGLLPDTNKSGLNAEIPSAAYISMQHKIVNMLDPQSHHNPQPKRSSYSGTLNIEVLVQNCSSSSASAMELLQSCIKPSI